MRDVKMTEIVRRGFARTSGILFKKSSLKTWAKLAFIAMFAGQLLSSQPNLGNNQGAEKTPPVMTSAKIEQKIEQKTVQATATPASLKERLASTPKVVWVFVLIGVILMLILVLVMMRITSRFEFVWFCALATNEVAITEPYHRHRMQGDSLFKVSLAIFLGTAGIVAGLIGLVVYTAARTGALGEGFEWKRSLLAGMIPAVLIPVLLLILVLLLLASVIHHFVVPVMALDKTTFGPAFRKVRDIVAANKKDFGAFYLWLVLLKIGAAVAGIIVTIASVIVILLAGLLVFGLGYLILMVILKLKILFIAYCVILGIPFLAMAIMLFAFGQLPFAVFFRSYSIEYLCALNCGYTYESLEFYGREKSVENSKSALAVPIVIVSLLTAAAIGGLLAAIAIPNFIQARNAARAKSADQTQTQTQTQTPDAVSKITR